MAVALLGIGAVSAQADVTVGRCVKSPTHNGHYNNESCSRFQGSDGAWEWFPTIEKTGFTGSAPGAVFESAGGTRVSCAAIAVTGGFTRTPPHPKITGMWESRRYTGCSFVPTGSECHQKGKAAGEAEMGGGGLLGPGVDHLQSMATTTLQCGTAKVKIGQGTGKGGKCAIGAIGPVAQSTSTLVESLSGSGGNQVPQELEKHKCNLEMEVGKAAWERASLTTEITLTTEEPVEIRVA